MNIIELAAKADKQADPGTHHWAEVFAAIVRAEALKEAHAKCMAIAEDHLPVSDFAMGKHDGALDCVEAIEGMLA